jgi:hypothetical protein
MKIKMYQRDNIVLIKVKIKERKVISMYGYCELKNYRNLKVEIETPRLWVPMSPDFNY